MDPDDLEECARELARIADMDPDDLNAPVDIARSPKVLGPHGIIVAPMTIQNGALVRLNGVQKIALRRGLTPIKIRWVVAHELGHWWLAREGYRGEDEEEYADRIAASILMPKRHFARTFHRHDGNVAIVSDEYAVSQTSAWLRVGEVRHEALAVVRPGKVRVRGEWRNVTEDMLAKWARTTPPKTVVKVPITDADRRVVLRVAGED